MHFQLRWKHTSTGPKSLVPVESSCGGNRAQVVVVFFSGTQKEKCKKYLCFCQAQKNTYKQYIKSIIKVDNVTCAILHMFLSQYAGSQDCKTTQVIYVAHFIHNFHSSRV